MKTPEMDLLDLCACRLGCQYLSDLRGLQGWQRAQLAGVLRDVAAWEAPLREWNDALDYLTGAPPENTAQAAKERLVSLLSQPCGAGIDKAT